MFVAEMLQDILSSVHKKYSEFKTIFNNQKVQLY